MAEYKEGQGIKTHRDNDVSIKIVDGQSGDAATDFLTIAQPGDTVVADTNDYGIPWLAKNETGDYCIPETDDNCALKVVVVDDDDDTTQHIGVNTFSGVTASGGTSDWDTVVTNGTTLSMIDSFMVASPGCFKYEIGLFDGVTTFTPYHTIITQPASSTFQAKDLCIPPIVGDGTLALRVRATNNDDTDNDAFASVCYKERTN